MSVVVVVVVEFDVVRVSGGVSLVPTGVGVLVVEVGTLVLFVETVVEPLFKASGRDEGSVLGLYWEAPEYKGEGPTVGVGFDDDRGDLLLHVELAGLLGVLWVVGCGRVHEDSAEGSLYQEHGDEGQGNTIFHSKNIIVLTS